MNSQSQRYLVGIDLGTSHSVLAYTDRTAADPTIEFFAIPQLIAPGNAAALPMLPSLRYHPADGEFAIADLQLPWKSGFAEDPVTHPIIGELARSLGVKSPGRLVVSAKSWLCHSQADRTAPILPWGAPADCPKISPVVASASYLAYLGAAWNHAFPEYPLAQQAVILTLPASFDEAARALTLQAARLAGLLDVRLLEEPLAACYDYLWQHQQQLNTVLAGITRLLVCDIGGGTSDFSLIRVAPDTSPPELTRIGVGDHLLLGGDNMDHALVHLAEQRLQLDAQRLGAAEFAQLAVQCRNAKERLLGDAALEQATVTLIGSGSRLVGGARSTVLTRDEVEQIILEGYFPHGELDLQPQRRHAALVEFGLPYAADPAITRHLAAFLSRHADTPATIAPDAVLFNGGVFHSPRITARLLSVLQQWRGAPLPVLANPRPDLAVAAGAVAYGLARDGRLVRIGGGSPRSFFLLVEDQQAPSAVCILPKGAEPGDEYQLTDRTFALRVGRPVQFSPLSSTDQQPFIVGQRVPMDDDRFVRLPPYAAALPADSGAAEIPVQLAAQISEVGTLQIDCMARDDPRRRWHLEFQLRTGSSIAPPPTSGIAHPQLAVALTLIDQVFGKKTKDAAAAGVVKTLRSDLEKNLGDRNDWDMALLRQLADSLLAAAKNRRRSPQHELLWCSLLGWCLRPGFGYSLDDWRLDSLWPLYEQGVQYADATRNWAEWWTLWRRVAGGLDSLQQQQLLTDIAPYLNPESAKRNPYAGQLAKRGFEPMVRLCGTLERLPIDSKLTVGVWLLQRLTKTPDQAALCWALGRLGARQPAYGSVHQVVRPQVVERWLDVLLTLDWKHNPAAGFAAAFLARLTEDRERDADQTHRLAVASRLRNAHCAESWATMVTTRVALSAQDSKQFFGDSLPAGLRLLE